MIYFSIDSLQNHDLAIIVLNEQNHHVHTVSIKQQMALEKPSPELVTYYVH